MAKETKVIQVYPSDKRVQEAMDTNSIFGWEVIGNQKFQEYTGQSIGLISQTTTKHYSTYVKLTFQREKSASWHQRVSVLENEWYGIEKSLKGLWKPKPDKGLKIKCFIFFGAWVLLSAILLMFMSPFLFTTEKPMTNPSPIMEMVFTITAVPAGVITYLIIKFRDKRVDEYNNRYADKRKALYAREKEIEAECERLING